MRKVEVPLALEQNIILCIFYYLPGKDRKRLMRISMNFILIAISHIYR